MILFSPDVVAFRRQLTRRDSGRRADEFGTDQAEQQDESLKRLEMNLSRIIHSGTSWYGFQWFERNGPFFFNKSFLAALVLYAVKHRCIREKQTP